MTGLPHWWDGIKQSLSAMIRFGSDASHMQFGMAIMVVLLLATRGRRPLLAWGLLAGIELINEAVDLAGSSSEATLIASSQDLLVTLLAPTVMLVILCSRRGRSA